MVNSNPETVSTDYDIADRLYFEPLTVEDVLAIIEREQPVGVVVGFGGQTPSTGALAGQGRHPPARDRLCRHRAGRGPREVRRAPGPAWPQEPPYGMATTVDEALHVAETLGYPVLLRPSFVLVGGRWRSSAAPRSCATISWRLPGVSPGYPVLIDRFLEGATELDIDVLSDGQDVWIAGLMEQIEEAGVLGRLGLSSASGEPLARHGRPHRGHGRGPGPRDGVAGPGQHPDGDPWQVPLRHRGQPARLAHRLLRQQGHPGIPVAKLAARILVGRTLKELLAPYWPYPTVTPPWRRPSRRTSRRRTARPAVAHPLVGQGGGSALGRFPGADVLLGPEMRSTGEVMSFGASFPRGLRQGPDRREQPPAHVRGRACEPG